MRTLRCASRVDFIARAVFLRDLFGTQPCGKGICSRDILFVSEVARERANRSVRAGGWRHSTSHGYADADRGGVSLLAR